MATANDDIVAAILADMRDSQAPAISPIKSPTKRVSSDSEEEIPASQPPPKRPRTAEGFSSLRNKIAYLETRRAKAKKSLCVLKEHVSKSSCPALTKDLRTSRTGPPPAHDPATGKER